MSSERFLKARPPLSPTPGGPPPDVTKLCPWESFVLKETILPQVEKLDPAKLRTALVLALLMTSRIDVYTASVAAALTEPGVDVNSQAETLELICELVTTWLNCFKKTVEGDPSETF